jgi:hypothetical protein
MREEPGMATQGARGWWAEVERRAEERPEESRCTCGLPDASLMRVYGVGYMQAGRHVQTCPACGGRAHVYRGAVSCEECGLREAPAIVPFDAA